MDDYLLSLYWYLTAFFFGFFVCLLPKRESHEGLSITYMLVFLCFIMALMFPLSLFAAWVNRTNIENVKSN